MKKEKAVVTGGAGFIGSHVVDELVARGFDVHIIDNLSRGNKNNVNEKATLHIEDIRNFSDIFPIFDGAKYVFHLAAEPRVEFSIQHPVESNDINVNGTLNVLIAARDAKVKRVVFSSSCAVYGDQEQMPLIESVSAVPKSPYGVHKYVGELYCKMFSDIYDLETVSLRYFNVYGPRHNSEGAYALVIAKFFALLSQGKNLTITGDGKTTRDYVNVKDIVGANMLAMESASVGKGEYFNIGTGIETSVLDIAKLVGGEVEFIASRVEPKRAVADSGLAQSVLGWKPAVDLMGGIEELKKLANIS